MKRLLALALSCALGACADTGGSDVEFPLYVSGQDVSEPFAAAGDVPVVLDRADLAFGPFYLCAGARAGSLCETARLEWLESVVVVGTSPDTRLAGELTGTSGSVRSFMYDVGITSLLTTTEPLVMPAAEALGGVSLVVEGSADVDGVALAFRADVPIAQGLTTEIGVPVVLGSSVDVFDHAVTEDEEGLLIEFDPRAWLQNVDFRALAEGACAPVMASVPCQIPPDTQAFRSLSNAVVSGERPRFAWGFTP